MVANRRCFVIAEAGVNHNGSLAMALDLIDAAADAGADAVKFQTFKAERLVAHGTPTAQYQADNCGAQDQLSMLRALELPDDAYPDLIERCAARAIEFMSTPFDMDSARMLASLGMRRIKVGSGDLTSVPFLEDIATLGLPIILSTGMANLDEVAEAVTTLKDAWAAAGIGFEGEMLTLLHCTSNYPAQPGDVNLRAMTTLRAEFGLPVGYSDHTEGVDVPIAAVALGADVIEKHITVDRSLPGPDHRASLDPVTFREMVRSVRLVESALGSATKAVCDSERAVRDLVRRSVATARALRRGDVLQRADLTLLRPGTGIAARDLKAVLGKRAVRDLEGGALLSWTDLQP
ncbi:MAG TPA: N-acetylneuraminate synthase [Burkholderiales bacterium]|nr:N-acetylneuraminate synthase [Burkholderiales bacterium]